MVTRKPLPQNAAVDPNTPAPAGSQKPLESIRRDLRAESDFESDSERSQPGATSQASKGGQAVTAAALPDDVPDALRPGKTSQYSEFKQEEEHVWGKSDVPPVTPAAKLPVEDLGAVPDVLRPGSGNLRPETNPFKRRATPTGSQDALDVAPMSLDPDAARASPSITPMSTGEPSKNPWQPALDEKRASPGPVLAETVADQDFGKEVWNPSQQPSRKGSQSGLAGSFALVSLAGEEEGSPDWDEVASPKETKPTLPPAPVGATDPELFEDRHAWDDDGSRAKGKAPGAPLASIRQDETGESWNLIDEPAPGQLSKQSTWENFFDADDNRDGTTSKTAEKAPALPPRTSTEEAVPPPPPRPADPSKSETYQIKNINWYDINAAKNPRRSPILVQNANGPCPLVALVNALTLTTPADTETALVDVLRTREQVSLDLLLDAVFDELMSSRRTSEDTDLPDVTELYAFLKGLHTGMNVNPRFVPTPEIVTAFKRTSLTHLHPSERDLLIPGTFEYTKEMRLYSIFSIPLIHGWIPAKEDAVYGAMSRQAQSYEDVQNLLFREEELEQRLSDQGLSEQEQELYQDILTINSFLSISATQLTSWGLQVICKAMKPGSIAILFRNDHFSTLYRHPQTSELLALVTDAGYSGHEEIVWESLVDVNGEHAEFFSGDFRIVGGAPDQLERASTNRFPGRVHSDTDWPAVGSSSGNAGWNTVQNKRNRRAAQDTDEPPMSPSHEQEDRDLALALQLQEEEEQQQRAEEERRRRESILSERYIEQQARQASPVIANRGGRGGAARGGRNVGTDSLVTPRRSSSGVVNIPVTTSGGAHDRGRTASVAVNSVRGGGGARGRDVQGVRPLVPPVTHRPTDEAGDEAPPSYEQAARQAPYTPPAGHPSHPASSPDRGGPAAQQEGVTGGGGGAPTGLRAPSGLRTASGAPALAAMGRGYRQGVPPSPARASASAGAGGRDKDCVVM
jgi:ubiquitin carboxyl-terminal hydrolase MINDY-1/2